MGWKRISCTLPENDLGWCKSRGLSPSKLLQERITQIRDEQNPILQRNLAVADKKIENITNKLHHSTTMLGKIGDLINDKYGEEVFNEIWAKI